MKQKCVMRATTMAQSAGHEKGEETRKNLPVYMGKSEYCYANSAAMLLTSAGYLVSPATIEVLTGMGIGATWIAATNFLFFDLSSPDVGISRAFKALGYAVQETVQPALTPDPMPALIEALRGGPVMLGPLSLGLLPYNPQTLGEQGADHYVLAYAADADRILLHDPWGFPCIPISVEALRQAWSARDIEYKRGCYRSWRGPQQMERPSSQDLFDRAIAVIQEVYSQEEPLLQREGLATGSDALHQVANRFREGQMSEAGREFLTDFSLPLAARRALDYSHFLAPHHPALAAIQAAKATTLGQCQAY
jgi:hypothetical protein